MSDAVSCPASGDTSATISAGCLGNDLLIRTACKTDEQATKLLNEATSKERNSTPDAKGVFMVEGGMDRYFWIKMVWIDDYFSALTRP